MPFFFRCFIFVLLSAIASAATSPTARNRDAVTVELSPIKIERRIFDPARPPPEMPKLTPPEVAACAFNLVCRVEGVVQGKYTPTQSTAPVVTELTFIVKLVVTLWLPTNSTPKINRHEEAHRQISEHYYARIAGIARQLGRRVIGTAVGASARDQVAMGKALEKVQDRLVNEFMHQIADRCLFAQKRFDQLTEHGMNATSEATAVARAIADERGTSDVGIPRTTAPARSGTVPSMLRSESGKSRPEISQ